MLARLAFVLAAQAIVAGSLSAQTAADPAPRSFEGSASLGFAQNRGNANSLTTNLADRLEYRVKGWAGTQDLAFFYGEADDEVNANFWNGGLRGDRRLTPRLGAFVVTRFDRNVLQGIASRFEEGLGLDYRLVDTRRDQLLVALGASAFQQRLTPGSVSTIKPNFPAARTALDYKHLFAEKAFFQQIVEYLPNLSDSESYLVNTESTIVAPLVGGLALRAGYVVRYNARPPVRDNVALKKVDTFLSSGITFSF
jgi:putative salt-induced outer membrane protein